MRALFFSLIATLSQNAWAGLYFEAGGFFTNDTIYFYGDDGSLYEESGSIGHFAVGVDFRSEKFLFDIQYRHESDTEYSDEKDITAKNSIGASLRYYLWD